jgi:hypothetical protein
MEKKVARWKRRLLDGKEDCQLENKIARWKRRLLAGKEGC